MRNRKYFGIAVLMVLFFSACIVDDDGVDTPAPQPIDYGTINITSLKITFFPLSNTTDRKTFEFVDNDGIGGADPTVNEQIMLMYPTSGNFFTYTSEIRFFDGSTDVTDDIKALETSYVVCYRRTNNKNLRVTDRDDDADGKPLGLTTEWVTVDEFGTSNPSNGSGEIFVTLNYQKVGKDETCDAGVRIFEANMNYQLN